MSAARSVIFNIIGKDSASPAFLSASKSAEAAATRMERTAARVQKSGAAMQLVGQKMSKAITLPVVAAAAVSADQAIKFQKSMTLIQTTADESAKKTAAISKGIKKVATETGTSLTDLGEGIYTVAKAGAQKWSAADQLKVLKAAAQGAKAENVDLGTAVGALTTLMQGYGMKASQAVQAENMLIRGSGLAKTTMQEFAGSLANVVPLAASLKISFPQIAGALATMTQHGETADRATQNLSNLITNLAGQSHQSSAMMQQLGINTVDLQQHLGQRGLTGTLNVVEKALARSSKGGRVVVDAFKKSQTATADLATELAHMPPSLQKISQQFEGGKIGYADYRKAVRGLGGDAFEMGMQFIGTMSKAKGFSDQLKSGDPTVRTAASTLQKMLGGVTGMRTALMLGGTSAKGFSKNVDQVAEAARKSGADVLGWSKTQGTLSVKIDKAKASLQVLAVEIGTALIPVISKVVDKVTAAVKWFENLSSTDKKFIGYSVVVLAALGPVMSIVGRVTRLIGLMWAAGAKVGRFVAGIRVAKLSLASMETKSYLVGTKVRSMFLGIGAAADRMGARVGAGVRMAGLAMAGLATAGAGYLGGDLAGKVGDKYTGGGVGGALERYGIHVAGGAAAGAAVGSIVPVVGTVAGAAVGAVGGAISGLISQWHHESDAAKTASAAAASALKQQKAAAQQVASSLESVTIAYNKQYRASVAHGLAQSGVLDIASKAGVKLPDIIDASFGKGGWQELAKVNTQLQSAYTSGKITWAQMTKVTGALKAVGGGAAIAEQRLELENRAMGHGVLTSKQLGASMSKLRAATAGTGTTLDRTSAAGKRNAEVIRENVAAIDKSAAAQLKHGRSAASVARSYQAQIGTLKQNLSELGFTRSEVEKLIAADKRVPKAIRMKVDANVANAITSIRRVGDALEQLHGKTIVVKSIYTSSGKVTMKAAGGLVTGPGSGTSDSIPARLSNGEFVVNARQAGKHRALLDAINSGAHGFAAGGTVGGAIAHAGGSYVVHGTKYESLRAAENAATSAMKILANYLPTFTRALGKSTDQLRTAEQTLIKDLKNASASQAQLAAIRVDFSKLNDLAKQRDRISAELGTKATAQTAYEKLSAVADKFAQIQSSVAQAAMGGFDVGTAGNIDTSASWVQARIAMGMAVPTNAGASGVISSVQAQLAQTEKFKAQLDKLKAEGLSKSIWQQLAGEGPAQAGATVAALAAGSKAQIKQLSGTYGQLQSVGNALGTEAAKDAVGAQLKAAQDTVAELKKERQALVNELRTLGKKVDTIGAQVAHSLNGTAGDAHTRARGKTHR